MNRKIGAHVSISGGLLNAAVKAKKIGANTIQIFSSAPQNWKPNTYSDAQIAVFKTSLTEKNISPVFVHAIYLVNLASGNPFIYRKSIDILTLEMQFASRIGAEGVIFHVGSHLGKGFREVFCRIIYAIDKILQNSPPETYLIIENSAATKRKIGGTFEEIGLIMKKINDPRLKFCLDTAHAFASGYELNSKNSLEKLLRSCDREIGPGKLVVIHANDSKSSRGSGIDRHENIGEGFIGKNVFRQLINHPQLINIPFIIETPGFTSDGPDTKNIKILKSLIE